MSLLETLREAAAELNVSLTQRQQEQLLQYLDLLQKWNKVYNLTAVRDPQEMLKLHLLDCLAVVPLFAKEFARISVHAENKMISVMDVGAGGGLPGVVLAICFGQVQITCVDAVAKKMAFVQQVAASLELPNLKAVHSRVELLNTQFDLITSRAFASLKDFTDLTDDRLVDGGVWLAMKGKDPVDEYAQLTSKVQVFHVEHIHVPQVDAQRCLVWLRKSEA